MGESFFREALPWNVVFVAYILFFVPIVSICLAAFTRLRKEPRKLAMYLFAVEIPVVVISLLRLLFIREMTGIYWLMFLSVFVAMLGFVVLLLRDRFKTVGGRIAAFLSQEVALIIGVYFSFLTLFFLPIILAVIVKGLVNLPLEEIGRMFVYTKGLAFFTYLTFFISFCLTVGLFVVTPVLGLVFYWKSFRKTKAALKSKLKPKLLSRLQWGFATFYVLLSVILVLQVQGNLNTDAVVNYVEADSFAEQQELAKELLPRSESIKTQFRNQYLAPYRYFGDDEINVLARGYKSELYLPEDVSTGVQSVFNVVASPFIYNNNFKKSVAGAKEQYEKLFDQTLQKGESKSLLTAMEATNTNDELKAGILDAEQRTVRLVSRKVQVNMTDQTSITSMKHNKMFAEVTVEEEYENVSDSVQEVFL